MRKFTVTLAAALLATVALADRADAWGKPGHLTICELSYRNLTRTSLTELRRLFASNDDRGVFVPGTGKMPGRWYRAFNYGCLEEDEMPRRHENDHYINVPRSTAAVTGEACPVATPDCTLSGIRRDQAILGDRSRSRPDRVRALMALGHWVGDLHQPLHVSFADDKGGNWVLVTMGTRCAKGADRPENLHAVWDKCLLDYGLYERVRNRADYKKEWARFTYTYRAADTLLANTSLTEEKQIVRGEPWQWANASLQMTRDPAVRYCTILAGVCRYSAADVTFPRTKRTEPIGSDYLLAHERLAENQVRLAGFRLAHLINKALDPAYVEPIQNSSQRP